MDGKKKKKKRRKIGSEKKIKGGMRVGEQTVF